ncbi:MAG: aminopeptidase [Flavobacteriaceae bacterium CG02_land_8_20_14_3_00_34_13]|nr:MAG: aminopeptidase [Flavobacteriaceae bacterium CG02_land_8_20_14_3_00_34_13]PJC08046.1 MAG: aminopeptidase [Flavobacteriaceae bacterium CG_4_9_14_0_8_um_filter_34_30]
MWKSVCLILLFCGFSFAQQLEVVDFQKVVAQLEIIPTEKKVKGVLDFHFKILQNTDSIFLDAKYMLVEELNSSKTKVSLRSASDKIWIRYAFQENIEYEIRFTYEAFPKQALYFFEDQIWTQGQGKYTSHWLPSLDDVNDKMIFNLSIAAPNEFTVIANGILQNKKVEAQKTWWHYEMQNPMSSYLAALVLGNFQLQTEKSASGIPLAYYYTPEDTNKVEPTYRFTKKMFDFLEEEIGVAYPWQNYKQVPVRDFLYAGMENTSLTIFSNAFVVDSTAFIDRNYVNVNAHELAHQWFGNLVTATNSEHHWLQEGFATYYALLAEREVFGEDYFYWKLYQSAEQLKELSDQGKGEALLNPKASSLTFYQKGAWALHILREKVGDVAFKIAVKNYLNSHAFQSVTTEDFLKEVEKASGLEMTTFKNDWLVQSTFLGSEVLQSLIKSDFLREFLELSALTKVPFVQKKEVLTKYLTAPINDYLGQEAVYQLATGALLETKSVYAKAFQSKNLFVRQALAISLNPIPEALLNDYQSLLKDASYLTMEVALYNLWLQFPENRAVYLKETEGIGGFSNKNIRQLWLTLAWLTEGFQEDQKPNYLQELRRYTTSKYSFEVREKAFQFLAGIQQLTDLNLKNLIDACLHPNWRFASSSRDLLDQLLQDPSMKNRFIAIKMELTKEKALWLGNKLDKR